MNANPTSLCVECLEDRSMLDAAPVPVPDPPPTGMPIVAVEKLADAAEIGTVGAIRFTRTGDLSQPLTASFRIDGTATPGLDIGNLNYTVDFMAGSDSAVIAIVPSADNLLEGAERVRISLELNPAYQISGSGTAEVVIIDNPPTVWVDEDSAVETETQPGEVILRRSGGDLSQALTVILAVGPDDVPPDPTEGGSPLDVASYRTVSVTFAPGEEIARQVVVTGPSAEAELAAGVAVALVDNAQYLVSSPAAVPVSATAAEPGQPAPPVEYYDVHFALVLARSDTRKTPKQKFAPTVEDFPVTFQIHHTRMEALKARYAAMGINVDDLQYLRGVHPTVHEEISEAQDKWKRKMMNDMGLNPGKAGDTAKFWKTVDMAEVLKFEAAIDATYGHLMIKSGATKAQVQAVLNHIDGAASARVWQGAKGERFAKALPWAAGALGIFAFAGDARAAILGVIQETPEAKAAWAQFEGQYRGLILKAANGGRITYFEGINLTTAIDNYLAAQGFSEQARSSIITPLRSWCDLNLTP